MRTFNLTLSTAAQSLYALMAATTDAIPEDGILPDRGNYLAIQAAEGNLANLVYVSDSNHANNQGIAVRAGDYPPVRQSNVNEIDFRNIYLQGSAGTPACVVTVGWR